MPKQDAASGLLCLMTVASLGCTSSATGTASRRDAYALATCTDTMTCCIQRNPGMTEACGLTAGEAAAHMAGVKMAMEAANEKEQEKEDADDGWREHCTNTYVACRDQKKPRWDGDCYACFRYCEGQRQWPFELCSRRSR